ncbi:MAG: hypothetical protein DCC67_04910 [Planctomycetota bacterium]|nr:MAG: hypothetical protein DCC67_04910 [Planctomycetota bacterium]
MRGTDLHTGASHIRDAFDDLQTAWSDASLHWNDQVSRRFCENCLEPLGPIVKLALDALARMSQLVDQMHRDCDA